jgi:hypothetical protein
MSFLSSVHVAWLLVLVGGCANVLSLELLLQRDRQAGQVITPAQFAYIAAEGFVQSVE